MRTTSAAFTKLTRMRRLVASTSKATAKWVLPLWKAFHNGKTHLSIGLAIAAAQSGRRVYYGTLVDLVTSLEDARAAGTLKHRPTVLSAPSLMVVEEVGYLPLSQTGALLFFHEPPLRARLHCTVLQHSSVLSRNIRPNLPKC